MKSWNLCSLVKMKLFIVIIISLFYDKHQCSCSGALSGTDKGSSDRPSNVALMTIFEKYGDNGTLNFEAFEHLLYSLGLGNIAYMDHGVQEHRQNRSSEFATFHNSHEHSENHFQEGKKLATDDHSHDHADHSHDHADHSLDQQNHNALNVQCNLTDKCLTPMELMNLNHVTGEFNITMRDFMELCPLLILQLNMQSCKQKHIEEHYLPNHVSNGPSAQNESGYSQSASVWGFSLLACLVISAVGLVAVAIIPIMHRVIYNHMLQFLVALAVGSLTGDAILHLLPHALIPHQEHHGHGDSGHGGHDRHPIWCGLAALGGIYLFFLVERLVGICSERQHARKEYKLKKLQECEASGGDASSTMHVMNSSIQPVMAKGAEIPLNKGSQNLATKLPRHAESATCEESLMMVHTNKDVRKFADDAHDELHQHCDPMVKTNTWGHSGSNGNGGHNHSHFASGSVASVAWMVIVGDGFHNFADGLAIGSAFASSLVGGLSTSIAVFCHELPHELGDFAMLLNAGMSAKQALVYNCVSSLLCLVGMVIGILVGNIAAATSWIFAVIAGLFLYIALVDMLPEMTRMDPKKGEHPLLHLALQNSGMLVGAAIMLVIALFEDQIQHSFSD